MEKKYQGRKRKEGRYGGIEEKDLLKAKGAIGLIQPDARKYIGKKVATVARWR